MRIAVLITGQARYLQQTGFWNREKVFPKTFGNMTVDYYVYLWDDGSDNLADRIVKAYDPVKFEIGNYNEVFHNHRHQIKQANTDATDWDLTTTNTQHLMCYRGDNYEKYAYNFPGMYLASARGARMAGPLSDYDIVIKTRSDNIFNNMHERQWIQLFSNMYKNPVFSDNIFTPWMRVKNGLPFFGDFCFIGKPHLMHNFLKNMDNELIQLATVDKHLLSDFLVNPDIPFEHWLWSRCGVYSKTDWLSISVVWPTPFGCTLLRQDIELYDKDYAHIEKLFQEEQHRRQHQ
tara:strand:+ start:1022 stop:1891 length:870 start_codon:yes stop_codon:yes gene_type:complete